MRILVIDDSPLVLAMIEALLTASGYDVVTAADADAAWTEIRSQRPDAIVTDAVMPGVSGPELVRALRGDAATRALPIVMLTGSDPVEGAAAGPAPLVDAWVRKSADLSPLLEALRQVTASRR